MQLLRAKLSIIGPRVIRVGLIAVLSVGFNLSIAPPASAIPGPTQVWAQGGFGYIVQSSPSVVDLNGTGDKDIVVGALNSRVYGLSGNDGTSASGWPFTTAKPVNSSAAIADVTGDSNPEIFIGNGDATGTCVGGGMYSMNRNGSQRYKFLAYDEVSVGGHSPCSDLAIHGSPAIADVDWDNRADLISTSLGIKSWSLDAANGTLHWPWPFKWDDTQFTSPALGDINNDGKVDIVVSGDASLGGEVNHRGGLVRAISGTGRELWRWHANEALYSSPAIGDVTGDGFPEIVVGAGDFYANNGGSNDSQKIFVLNRFGQVLWARDLGARTLASPTLADFTGDGRLDIAIGTWIGANDGQIFVMDGITGNNTSGYPKESGGNLVIGQITTADFDGDGAQDVLATTGGGVYAHSGDDGTALFTVRTGSFQNASLIDDLDSDGRLDIVIAGSLDGITGHVSRWEMPDSTAELGTNGWPKFRKNAQQTGSYLSAPLQNPGQFVKRTSLTANQQVVPGDSLLSPNGQNALLVRASGDLVLDRYFVNRPWASFTNGNTRNLIMQGDGNLVLYDKNGGPIWWSGTGGNANARLEMQNDGNMVIYSSGNAVLWQSGTYNPGHASYVNDTLYGGDMQTFQELRSQNGQYHLDAQKDGNFVLYGPVNALWHSGSFQKPQSRLSLQSDGNMVAYGWNNTPIWWTGTRQRAKLILQNDGNLVLYNGLMQPLWWSGTGGQQ